MFLLLLGSSSWYFHIFPLPTCLCFLVLCFITHLLISSHMCLGFVSLVYFILCSGSVLRLKSTGFKSRNAWTFWRVQLLLFLDLWWQLPSVGALLFLSCLEHGGFSPSMACFMWWKVRLTAKRLLTSRTFIESSQIRVSYASCSQRLASWEHILSLGLSVAAVPILTRPFQTSSERRTRFQELESRISLNLPEHSVNSWYSCEGSGIIFLTHYVQLHNADR